MNKQLKRIIFVDDDEIIGMVSKRLFEHMHTAEEVIAYSDSVKALQFIKDEYATAAESRNVKGADLIFLDIDMPGFGGFEILYILKELKRAKGIFLDQVYFVIITSHKTDKEVQLASRYEVLDLLEKPLRRNDILELMNRIQL